MKRRFAPNGYPIAKVTMTGFETSYPTFNDKGEIDGEDTDQFPSLSMYRMENGDLLVESADGDSWLSSHCRVVEVDDDWDEWDEDNRIDAWPEEEQENCHTLRQLHDGLRSLAEVKANLPLGYYDAVLGVVMDQVVAGRIEDDIAARQARLDAFRAGRVEIEHLDESPHRIEADLDAADQKHQAQMADLGADLP